MTTGSTKTRKSKPTRREAKQEPEKFVDLSKFEIEKREVSVNGKLLPLAIGDKFLINDSDHLVKTVASIQIHEDGRIGYMLEWFDTNDSSFKSEWVTSTELAFLNRAKKERPRVLAFGQPQEN